MNRDLTPTTPKPAGLDVMWQKWRTAMMSFAQPQGSCRPTPPSKEAAQAMPPELMRGGRPMTEAEITEAMRWVNPGLLDICRWSFTWGVRFAEARNNIND